MRLWQLLSASLQAGDERFKAELGWVVNLDMWDEAKQLAAQELKGATSQLSSVTGQEHVRQAGLESLEMQVRCAALRCAALRCAVLCCAALCCAVLCCAVLCCAVLCLIQVLRKLAPSGQADCPAPACMH